jgi:hypothetical protein
MSCALTQARGISCRDATGGIVRVAFMPWEVGLAYTTASGLVDAITGLSGATTAYGWELPQNMGTFSSAPTGSRENGTIFFTDTLSVVIHKFLDDDPAEIYALAKGRWVAFIEDRAGNYIMSGIERGLEVTGGTAFATGTAIGDMSGHTLELTGESATPPQLVTQGGTPDFATDVGALSANLTVTLA